MDILRARLNKAFTVGYRELVHGFFPLPARRRVAKLVVKEIVTRHRLEPGIDAALLTDSNLVDGGLHVVVDAALRNSTEDFKGPSMGIKQHLM